MTERPPTQKFSPLEQQPAGDFDPTAPFPVVGIGASAGGLQALGDFFAHAPSNSGMAFVVILHLSPELASNAAAVLQRHTALPVAQVTESVLIEPNRIYVIPPDKQLEIHDGRLELVERELVEGRRVPIDAFFRSLADAYGPQAGAVILSGAGSDGTLGLKGIKEGAGVVCVQDPQEAEFDGMPRSAIATGLVDFVLPVAALPEVLHAFWRRAAAMPIRGVDAPDAEGVLQEIFAVLRARTGHDFSQYKRATVLRRLGRRLQVTGVTDLPAYLALLHTRADEVQALLQDLLISVTNFFRDPAAWAALEAVIPRLFTGKSSGDQLRVWVPACATGEEAYTVAMLLMDYADTLAQAPSIQVFATDIDEDSIAQARQGIYPEAIAGDITPERLKRYFRLDHGNYSVRKDLRERVLFAPHNLLRDPPFLKVDLITCRNVLIYLNRAAQDQVLQTFHYSLCPDGLLLLGSSESVDGMPNLFTAIDKQARLFQRRNLPAVPPLLAASSLPTRRTSAPPAARSEEASSLSDLHQQLLADHAPPSVIANQDGEIVHLSRGIGRFLQFDEGVPSHNLLQVIHSDLRVDLRAALFAARQEQSSAAARRVPVTLDGVVRLVDLVVEPIRTPEWAQGYHLVLVNDAGVAGESDPATGAAADDQVRQVEADLQRTREQLRGMVEQYETAVEEQKSANEELQAINEELRAASEELETSKEELQSVNEELTTVNLELRHKVDEVSQAHNDLQNLIASTQIGTLFLDRRLRIKRYTPGVDGIFNLLPTDLNRPIAHVTHTLAYDRLTADAVQVLETSQGITREVRSSGGQWYLVQMLPYRTDDNRIDGVVLTFVDITERKRIEEEREQLLVEAEQARREAEAALHVRTQFLSIASHELRTPLTPLLGYAQVLQARAAAETPIEPQKLYTQLTTIVRQAERLNTLVEQLLEVSRLQRGQFALDRQPVDLAALVAQSVEEFQQSLPTVGAQHAITLVRPEAPVLVFGDAMRLDQVVHNLLSNAVKYSAAGGEIEVRVAQQPAEVVLEVRDQGIGIPVDAQARLFDPFYRAGNVSPQSSGFGIGLYIVQEIVANHDGRVEVQSMEGAGSRFRVILPALDREE